jgi:probable rRNA maturation factor
VAVDTAPHTVTVVDGQHRSVDPERLTRLGRHVLHRLHVPVELELSITCVDRGPMGELNATHMGDPAPTDVLAFPIDDVDQVVTGVPGLLGDVVLCPQVAADQAGDHDRTPQAELDLLLVHGILHLLGHDHAHAEERDRMFGLTDELLATFADSVPR